jgi:hypothetical protein
MDTVNKIHYKIGDTKTRSVTLFPTRAQVFRELKDVDLKVRIFLLSHDLMHTNTFT